MDDGSTSLARENVLNASEQLFSERGYSAVTLRDIAQALNMKQASLYYHVTGKEDLYVQVMERSLQRHQAGLSKVMQNAKLGWDAQLYAVARWLLSQPAMNVARMIQSDMPELHKTHAERLMTSMYRALFMPLEDIFVQAQRETDLTLPHAGVLVGALFALIEGIRSTPMNDILFTKEQVADQLIEVLVRGLRGP